MHASYIGLYIKLFCQSNNVIEIDKDNENHSPPRIVIMTEATVNSVHVVIREHYTTVPLLSTSQSSQ